ncbi:hypothetical protein RF11_09975 [Thelohanellus kitauei]|uniref:Uncharacterized protein n=1 Tax=Thelohanellus kitauei TaxID=669202 RepID=A0A0C2NA15_THEKT|nr:hypothetical protein RF11_09975 [Thelohanellus kitauei]
MDSMRVCLQKEENELCLHAVIEQDNDRFLFKYIQFIVKDEHGDDNYFDYAETFSIEKRERSYHINEEYTYTYNRVGNTMNFETLGMSVKVTKINEHPFNVRI